MAGEGNFNEIIAKIEMKKIQNLIENRLNRKNTLVDATCKRTYPLNQLSNGKARAADVGVLFKQNIGKLNKKIYPNAKNESRATATATGQKHDRRAVTSM